MSLAGEFCELFDGRKDAVGSEQGGALRTPNERVTESWWRQHIISHLQDDEPIGVYPVVHRDGELIVKWGCVDFDIKSEAKPGGDYPLEEHCHVAALNLRTALEAVGITGWIEVTRSRGRHVWVFAREWVKAELMRTALLAASQLAGTPTREVNPKGLNLEAHQLGNYVRTMYPGGARAIAALDTREPRLVGGIDRGRGGDLHSAGPLRGHRLADDGSGRGGGSQEDRWSRWLCDSCGSLSALPRQGLEGHLALAGPVTGRRDGSSVGYLSLAEVEAAGASEGGPRRVALTQDEAPICAACFAREALATRCGSADLQTLAELYVAPAPRATRAAPEPSELQGDMVSRMGGLAFTIWRDGPLDGVRHKALYKLACQLADDGKHTEEEALELLTDADERWGKFHDRPDGERRLQETIDKAWSR